MGSKSIALHCWPISATGCSRQAAGPAPKPRWMPRPALLYAQVVKQYRRRRLVRVRHRVVFGTLTGVKHVLAAHDWQINTAFIERVNLTIRQHVAAIRRRVATLCKRVFGHPVLSVVMAACITHFFQPFERLLSSYFHAANVHLAALL